jgi:hypothetical protein
MPACCTSRAPPKTKPRPGGGSAHLAAQQVVEHQHRVGAVHVVGRHLQARDARPDVPQLRRRARRRARQREPRAVEVDAHGWAVPERRAAARRRTVVRVLRARPRGPAGRPRLRAGRAPPEAARTARGSRLTLTAARRRGRERGLAGAGGAQEHDLELQRLRGLAVVARVAHGPGGMDAGSAGSGAPSSRAAPIAAPKVFDSACDPARDARRSGPARPGPAAACRHRGEQSGSPRHHAPPRPLPNP